MMRRFALAFALLALARPVAAQVVNPTTIQFDHVDFALTDSYEVGYFSSVTATTPVQSAPLPKPTTCAPCTGPLPSRPSGFQTWYVAVRGVLGTGASAQSGPWSAPLVPFVRTLSAPANVLVR